MQAHMHIGVSASTPQRAGGDHEGVPAHFTQIGAHLEGEYKGTKEGRVMTLKAHQHILPRSVPTHKRKNDGVRQGHGHVHR